MLKKTLEEILNENYARATVFELLGIDYAHALDKSLQQVCADYGVSEKVLTDALKQAKGKGQRFRYEHLDLPVLIAYLKYTHHEYAKAKMPLIEKNIKRLNMAELEKVFTRFSKDLTKHMLLEEKVIFPFIEDLHRLLEDFDLQEASLVLGENSADVLCASHTQDDDETRELRDATDHFHFEASDPMLKKVLMSDLMALEADIIEHASIEDHILFKKAKRAESLLRERVLMASRSN